MLEMAQAAAQRGMKVIAFTDHSQSLGVTGGLSIQDHKKQAAEIKKVQEKLSDSILVLHATEVEIKADGKLDYPDEFLASLDLVLASLHTSLRQPREKVTQRVLNAIRNPNVDIIGHPTGRLIPDRRRGGPRYGGALQGRGRIGSGDGDQRPPRPTRPGRYVCAPRKGPGHTFEHQHRFTFRRRFRYAAIRRGHRPARLGGVKRCDQLLAYEKLLDWLKSRG